MTLERAKDAAERARRARITELALEAKDRIKEEHLPLLAAGLAYYGMLAMVPALIAVVSIYGLVADPSDVAQIVNSIGSAAPSEVTAFVERQLTDIVNAPSSGLGLSAGLSLLGALWAASSGTSALIRGVNIAFGTTETRNPVRLRVLSLGITIGLAAFVGTALLVLSAGESLFGGWLDFLRWPLLLVGMVAGLAVLYRVGPAKRVPGWRVASAGALFAALSWLLASFGLNIYVTRFGSFNETYGTLGAVVVTMLWLFVSGLVVLVGAVIDGILRERRA